MAFIPSKNVTSPDSIQNQDTILLKSSPIESISSLSSSYLEFDCELAAGKSIANDGVIAATILDGSDHHLQSICLSNQQ